MLQPVDLIFKSVLMPVKLHLWLDQLSQGRRTFLDELRWDAINTWGNSETFWVYLRCRSICSWRRCRWHLTIRILWGVLGRRTILRLLVATITLWGTIGGCRLWHWHSLLWWEKAWSSTIHHSCIKPWFYRRVTRNDSLQKSHHICQVRFLSWTLRLRPASNVRQYYWVLLSQVSFRLNHLHWYAHV